MKVMKNRKSNLDEREEQQLLRIEHNGCWFAFWGLLVAIGVQIVMYGNNTEGVKAVAGEWIIFMILAIYLEYDCIKNNIWDRKLKADAKTNVIVALIAGIVMGVFNVILILKQYPDKIAGGIAAGAFLGVVTFTVCFVILEAFANKYRKDKKKLEEAEEEK